MFLKVNFWQVPNITLLHQRENFCSRYLNKIFIKLERFLKDAKWQPQFIIIGKTSRYSQTYSEPSKTSKMELFENIVTVFSRWLFLQNIPCMVFHRVDVPLVKLKKNLVRCLLVNKKSRLQSLQISLTFKFNFILTLLPYCGTLLIANSIHVFLISNWFTHAVKYIWH